MLHNKQANFAGNLLCTVEMYNETGPISVSNVDFCSYAWGNGMCKIITIGHLFSRATNFAKRAKALFCGNYFRGLIFHHGPPLI